MVSIPDGVSRKIDPKTGMEDLLGSRYLRVCVDMTPFLDASCQHKEKRGWVDCSLENWTQFVLGTMTDQISFYYKIPGDKSGTSKIPLKAYPVLVRTERDIQEAQTSWRKQFQGQYKNLCSLFKATCDDQLKKADLREQNKRKNGEPFIPLDETDLVEFTQRQDEEDFKFKLLLNAQPSGTQQLNNKYATASATQQHTRPQGIIRSFSKSNYSFEEIAKNLTSVSYAGSQTAFRNATRSNAGASNRNLGRVEVARAFSDEVLSSDYSGQYRVIVESSFYKFAQVFNLIHTPNLDSQNPPFIEQSLKEDNAKLDEEKDVSYLPPSNFENPDEDNVEIDPVDDAVRRKYAEILARPTLAQYYGLCLDFYVQIPSSQLGEIFETGYIGCGLKRESDIALNWTFFSLSLENNIFVAGEEVGDAQGIVNMTETTNVEGARVPRYGLNGITSTEVAARLDQAIEDQKNYRGGNSSPADFFTQTPQEKYGIGLFDRNAREVEQNDEDSLDLPCRNHFYETDLIDGFRPDIGVLVKAGNPNESDLKKYLVWRPLTTAKVEYLDPAFRNFSDMQKKYGDSPFARREDGYVQISSGTIRSYKLVDSPTVQKNEDEVVWEQLFNWTGSGLGVPETERILGNDQATLFQKMEVPVSVGLDANISFKVPKRDDTHKDLLLPPQRIGMKFYCGMRKRYRFGCGLDVRDASRIYKPGLNILGTKENDKIGPGTPYHYKRRAKIKSPQVLLLPNDPLITGKTANREKSVNSEIQNNNLTTIVFTDVQDEATTRIFVPPRISPDLAEELGVFDQLTLKPSTSIERLPGAYESNVERNLNYRLTSEGEFPPALRGGIHWNDDELPSADKIVGQALVPIGRSEKLPTHDPHFVDPWVTGIRVVVNLRSSDYIDALEKKKILFRKLDLLKEPKITELERTFDYVKIIPFQFLNNTPTRKGKDPIPVAVRVIRKSSSNGKDIPLVKFSDVWSKKWDSNWKGSKLVPLLEVHIAEGVDAEILVYPEIDWKNG